MDIVVDTSVLVGALDPADTWHRQATGLIRTIAQSGHSGLYLDCVVAEALSTTIRRSQERRQQMTITSILQLLHTIVPETSITWIFPRVPDLYGDILHLIQTSTGALNFNDALIALACRDLSILAIASFDTDFDQIPWLRRLSQAKDATMITPPPK